MRWNIGDDVPRIDEMLRRRDDGRWARVYYVIEPGNIPFDVVGPIYNGDVVMQLETGGRIVTSGGAYFWERWERPDAQHLLSLAFAVGCNPRA
jgi:hypothetical protein